MKTEESNNRKRNKLGVVFLVACVGAVGYYLHSSYQENTNLKKKQIKIYGELRRYTAEYATCKAHLNVDKAEVLKSHESNKRLEAKVHKLKQDIALLGETNNKLSEKLTFAYSFLLDVNVLLGNGQNVAEDIDIKSELAADLKQKIQKLKSEHTVLEKLKTSHDETTRELKEVKIINKQLMAQARHLFKTNAMLKKNLTEQSAISKLRTQEALHLGDIVQKFENVAKKTSGAPQGKPTETPKHVKHEKTLVNDEILLESLTNANKTLTTGVNQMKTVAKSKPVAKE